MNTPRLCVAFLGSSIFAAGGGLALAAAPAPATTAPSATAPAAAAPAPPDAATSEKLIRAKIDLVIPLLEAKQYEQVFRAIFPKSMLDSRTPEEMKKGAEDFGKQKAADLLARLKATKTMTMEIRSDGKRARFFGENPNPGPATQPGGPPVMRDLEFVWDIHGQWSLR